MSGDSKKTDKKSTTPSQPMQTVQPGMPGQINALADQLSAGYGQPSSDIMTQLMQYYQPMALPNYAPTANTPAPTTPSKPSKPTMPELSDWLQNLFGGINR